MDKFNKTLDEVISACIKLSEEWEKIEVTHSDQLVEKYPFDKDFEEVILELVAWKEHINK
ncbi:hypothetical protein [Bacillus cereus group sp. BfR-BA-01323]|uniref:hypothetical protein n=1 Tax=Bacillus cereus group sp. BfR-BA-01323 TaxID=2920299 RepID=UPI001F5A4BAA|nr:hypothetical protein [Bacillus cereus]